MGVYVGLRRCSCCTSLLGVAAGRDRRRGVGLVARRRRRLTLLALHVARGAARSASTRSARARGGRASADGFVDVCRVDDIPDTRARDRPRSAASASRSFATTAGSRRSRTVCQHQNGPLGEGKVVDGCVVCPWHGYEYRPETGASPPPFTEKVPTYRRARRRRRRARRSAAAAARHASSSPPARDAMPRPRACPTSSPAPTTRSTSATTRRCRARSRARARAPSSARRWRWLAGVALIARRDIAPSPAASSSSATCSRSPASSSSGPIRALRRAPARCRRATLLVAPGKHGAAPLVRGLTDRAVIVDGQRIYRDGNEMLEIAQP